MELIYIEPYTVHATDVSNASRTLMMDLHKLQWDENTLLKTMNIPRCMLPEIKPSSGVLGNIRGEEEDNSTGKYYAFSM